MILNFKKLGNSWIHKKNSPNNDNLKFLRQVFYHLQLGESVWVDSNLIVLKHQNLKENDNQPSIFFRTGGTSGQKKWIEHKAYSIEPAIKSLLLKIDEDCMSSLCCLPLNHVGGMMQVFRSIYSGGKIIFSDYRILLEKQDKNIITNLWISLVPTQLNNLLASRIGCDNLKKFKGIFVGGATLTEKLTFQCRKHQIPLFPTYGMTETAGMVTILDSNSFHQGIEGVGMPLSHAQLLCRQKTKAILVKSKSLCLNLTTKDFFDNKWLRTPDYGRQDAHGNWIIDGRLDRTIITGGEKVNPVNVEKIILQCDSVSECLVCGVHDEKWGQKVVAFVTPENIDVDKIKLEVKEKLKSYMIPKEWKNLSSLPINEMGKPSS